MTHILTDDAAALRKWRQQANQAAYHLKKATIDKPVWKLGFAFDDAVVTVSITSEDVRTSSHAAFADSIYEAVLQAAKSKRAADAAIEKAKKGEYPCRGTSVV